MSDLKETITDELKKAMKAQDKLRVSTLRMVLSEMIVVEKSGKEVDYVEAIKAYGKKLKRSIDEYRKLGLNDKISNLENELAIVNEFIPKQMDDEQLIKIVNSIIEANNFTAKEMGKVMKLVMSAHGDVVDGKRAQEIAKEKFAQ